MYLSYFTLFFPFVVKIPKDNLSQLLYDIFISGIMDGYYVDGLSNFPCVCFDIVL